MKASRNMKLGLHLPTLGSVGHDFSHPAFRVKNERILASLEAWTGRFAFEYGVIHPPEGNAGEISVEYFYENIRRIPLKILLENIPEWPLKKFIDFFHKTRRALPTCELHLCLDIPHACLSDKEWIPFFESYFHEIKLVHLSNYSGGEDWHYPFQVKGELELNPVLDALKSHNYRGLLNLELYPHEPGHISGILQDYSQAAEFAGSVVDSRTRRRRAILSSAGAAVARLVKIGSAR